jgi:hypothetical protein
VPGKKSTVGDKAAVRRREVPITWDRVPFAVEPILDPAQQEEQHNQVRAISLLSFALLPKFPSSFWRSGKRKAFLPNLLRMSSELVMSTVYKFFHGLCNLSLFFIVDFAHGLPQTLHLQMLLYPTFMNAINKFQHQ